MQLTVERGNFQAFFETPFNAYPGTSAYVSPLKSDLARFLDPHKNPLFDNEDQISWFTVHRNGRAVGRITAHCHSASNRLYGWRRAYFGFFDCVEDAEVARTLLTEAENWARHRGFDEILGNFNLTAMQQIGVVTSGFDKAPYTDLVWNPPHVPKFLAANGYHAEFPMTTFEVDLAKTEAPELGSKQQAILEDPDYSFLPISRWNVRKRMEQARQLLNVAFAANPMFVPVSSEEFHFQAKDMAWIVDPRISALLTWRGEPIATILCVPDLNPFLTKVGSCSSFTAPWHFLTHKLSNKRAVLIFSAVRPDMQGKGVNPLVLRRVILAMKAAGYEKLGNTWIGDENRASLAQKEKAGATRLHRLHLFRKSLS
ncbi:GNAT family N-acetyltransferase [uncultured Roseibium sp.]|uniref:GNAT family N-acetyltransferase n=1 Tax=uncultured Roseibium sp. TaxID=1936171 RepID=UPI00262334A9|nr:GNAT family N-acetyltransferase [uncultured Roseibium sp.]